MIIWGKVVGAVLGLVIFGPAGGILGLMFGQIFDNGLKNILNNPIHSHETRAVFFKTVFQTMGYIAKIDGVVSENEIKTARQIMVQDFQLNPQQMLLAMEYFNSGKQPGFNLATTLDNFKIACGSYLELRRFFLEIQVKAALADHKLHAAGKEGLLFICRYLELSTIELEYQLTAYGFYTAQQQQQQQQYKYYQQYSRSNYSHNYSHHTYNTQQQNSDALADAYRLLGVSANDNLKTIKNAYRRLISRYHPDKLVAKGLPPEMLNSAKEKTQQITVAYDLIMRSRM